MASCSGSSSLGILLLLLLSVDGAINGGRRSLKTSSISTVPAVYVLGDSLADVGNNNHLITYMKADFPHNGIDFAGGKATGRFSNGKNGADLLAEKLGLPSAPPYLSIGSNTQAFFNGVNFASGGAGIFDATHNYECLSLNKQIDYLSTVSSAMVEKVGNAKAQGHLAKSIFVIFIGSNDIFAYVRSNGNTHQQFIASLISQLQGQLQRIYNIGARKFVFMGTGLVGCCPALRTQSDTGDCKADANSVSNLYNQAAASLLQEMKSKFSDMNYTFFNSYLALLKIIQNPTDYGFTEVKAACCGMGDLNAKVPCIPISSYCSNRTNHMFWDLYHPTEATDRILTTDIFYGSAPHVYPINLRQLSAL